MKNTSSFMTPKALLSVQQVNSSTVLAMMYSDGCIEFRDSQSLEIKPPDEEGQISSLGQIGFAFPANRSCGLLNRPFDYFSH